jgi:radical SAM-linked protein
MFKIRVKFSKEEKLKFLSHLDLVRTIGRIIRRAEVPFVLTSGFSPHIKITFSPPLPVGICGTSEFFDLHLSKKEKEEEIKNRLSLFSPEGIKIIRVEYLSNNFIPLSRISYGEYEVFLNVENSEKEKIEKFLNQDKIILKKFTKKGEKEFNLKEMILKFESENKNKIYVLNLILSLKINPQDIFKNPYFEFLSSKILKINRKLLYYKDRDKILPLT